MQYRELKLRYAHRLPTFGQNVQAFQIPFKKPEYNHKSATLLDLPLYALSRLREELVNAADYPKSE